MWLEEASGKAHENGNGWGSVHAGKSAGHPKTPLLFWVVAATQRWTGLPGILDTQPKGTLHLTAAICMPRKRTCQERRKEGGSGVEVWKGS